jgi:hypothetical protein
MKRNTYTAAGLVIALIALGVTSNVLNRRSVAHANGAAAPHFEVDTFWPKPLPNHWVLGMTIGVSVDAQDHIWIVHRSGSNDPGEQHASTNPPQAECCSPAPPVLEFDQAGNLLRHWGGPGQGYDWPNSNHGITIDYKGNVWIAGNGRGQAPGSEVVGAVPAGARRLKKDKPIWSGFETALGCSFRACLRTRKYLWIQQGSCTRPCHFRVGV